MVDINLAVNNHEQTSAMDLWENGEVVEDPVVPESTTSLLSALEWKERGNKLIALKRFPEALDAYDCAIKALEQESISTDSSSLNIQVWSNRALVLLKLREFQQAEQAASKVLEMDPGNVKALMRRASSREGQHFGIDHNTSTNNRDKSFSEKILVPAIDDLQKALALLDKERVDQDESTPEHAKSSNKSLTAECRRILDRLEKEYRRLSRKEERQRRLKNALSNDQLPEEEEVSQMDTARPTKKHREKPKPENMNRINGFQLTTSAVPPPAQQKNDVVRLLLARQKMLRSIPKNGNTCSSPEGEAFFLLDWNWWVQWCRYVDFFYLKMMKGGVSNDKGATARYSSSNTPERVRCVLEFFPPGAVVADKPRYFSKNGKTDCDMSDDSDEEDFVDPPGRIDNSVLLLNPSDRFYQQWYLSKRTLNNGDVSHPVSLQPNLVRGYHYELIPREVYNALRSWYGETTPSICRRTSKDHRIVLYPRSTESVDKSNLQEDTIVRKAVLYCNACRAPGAVKRCKHCMAVQYCDRVCQESHWPFHKIACKSIQAYREEVDELRGQFDAKSMLPRDSMGRVGLNQLGNTCFMNSALQSLSHATPLTRFFLSSRFKADLNDENPLGTGGKLAMAYETVMKDLWMNPAIRATSPVTLKRAIAQFAPRFAGCLQHDAQEFLTYLLDALHEDLNRIRRAPYVEMPDVTNGDNMAIASAEAWDAHQRRNDSLVFDSFYGQFQSTCVCPQCDRVSVAFDAFNHVSLEIPQPGQNIPILLHFFVHFDDGKRKTAQCGMLIHRQSTISEFRKRVSEMFGISMTNLVLTGVDDHKIITLFPDEKPVSFLTRYSDIVAYEVVPCDSESHVHSVITQYFLKTSSDCGDDDDRIDGSDQEIDEHTNDETYDQQVIGVPIMTSLPKEKTCSDLYNKIWRLVRRMIVPLNADNVPPEDMWVDSIDAVGKYRPNDVLTVRVVDAQGRPIAVCSPNGKDEPTSVLPRDSEVSLADFLGKDCTESFLFLSLEWKNPVKEKVQIVDPKRFLDFEEHPSWGESRKAYQRVAQNQNKVTLDQCFRSFSRPERLDEHNMWYCSRCKEHVRALKTIKLWRLPNILVVHLKRFEFRNGFRRDKLDTFVDFPLENLEMDHYTANCSKSSEAGRSFIDDGVPAQYDLFAVVNHYGRMGFGHYTAFAQQWDESGMSNEWSLFDDSSVQPASRGEIKSSAAYLLFYRRREFN
ncbi:ubiquitin carboxyl-terminal hydrolase [Nitzschia inconspicua]|uniref:ubiquitinyl hydrolase 1 n=1 Tax=Nitzschia inconspicua TaxID=303405 RepID=A0A9K3LQ95_9STRA|nr:ubiquitin carboxyl-terminal hydrolase [Nitzschia inconspicua]